MVERRGAIRGHQEGSTAGKEQKHSIASESVKRERNDWKKALDADIEVKPLSERLTQEEIDKLAEAKTLEIFHVGSDKINYNILKMLPTDINHVMIELNFTKVPVYTRINNLQDAGLVSQAKGTGKINQTELARDFVESMETIKNKIDKRIKSNLMEVNLVMKSHKDTTVARKK